MGYGRNMGEIVNFPVQPRPEAPHDARVGRGLSDRIKQWAAKAKETIDNVLVPRVPPPKDGTKPLRPF